MTMMTFGCGEVWETQSVFQGAVGRLQTRRAGHRPVAARQWAGCPQLRRLSAAGGSERKFKALPVSKSLTRSVSHSTQSRPLKAVE